MAHPAVTGLPTLSSGIGAESCSCGSGAVWECCTAPLNAALQLCFVWHRHYGCGAVKGALTLPCKTPGELVGLWASRQAFGCWCGAVLPGLLCFDSLASPPRCAAGLVSAAAHRVFIQGAAAVWYREWFENV